MAMSGEAIWAAITLGGGAGSFADNVADTAARRADDVLGTNLVDDATNTAARLGDDIVGSGHSTLRPTQDWIS